MKKKRKSRYIFRAGLGAAACLLLLFGVLVKRYGAEEADGGPEQVCGKGDDAGPEASDALVQIRAGELSGSGVLYKEQDGRLIIITAAHVLEQAKGELAVCFRDAFTVETGLYQTAEDADLAFVIIPRSEIPPENMARYAFVKTDKKAYDALQKGDGIFVMGKEWDGTVSVSQGILEEAWIYTEDFGQYMMLVRGTARPGMSGGGVFDKDGNFIGILCGGSAEGDAEEDCTEKGDAGGSAGELAVLPLGIIEAGYQKIRTE